MLLNAEQVSTLLQTNGLGAKAQVGYDLTLKSINRVHGGAIFKDKSQINTYSEILPMVNPTGKIMYTLNSGVYSLTFDQGIKLPADRTAFIVHRSSIVRCGAIITSGVFDPGFEVENMGAIMFVYETILIERGARVAQVIIHENYQAMQYQGQYQGAADKK